MKGDINLDVQQELLGVHHSGAGDELASRMGSARRDGGLAGGAQSGSSPRSGPGGTLVGAAGKGFVLDRPCGFDTYVHIGFTDTASTFFYLTEVLPRTGNFRQRRQSHPVRRPAVELHRKHLLPGPFRMRLVVR